MLKLFQYLFGDIGPDRGPYPETLIHEAIERAVDGTDPRIRALLGYHRRLREPVIRAIEHVIALVDRLPAPLPAVRGNYRAEPLLTALFASADHMLETIGRDPGIVAFLDGPGGHAERIAALLLAARAEKKVLGMDLQGDMLRRDVAQVAVSFSDHHLLDPSPGEATTRDQLRRRAFDHLLTVALARIAEYGGKRADLARERDIVGRKMRALRRGGGSFERQEAGVADDPAELAAELEEIEAQLAALGTDADLLQAHLDIVADVLAHGERQLWIEETILTLDRMNIQRDVRDPEAQSLPLWELNDPRGQRAAILLVTLDPAELPRRGDLLAEAQRYL